MYNDQWGWYEGGSDLRWHQLIPPWLSRENEWCWSARYLHKLGEIPATFQGNQDFHQSDRSWKPQKEEKRKRKRRQTRRRLGARKEKEDGEQRQETSLKVSWHSRSFHEERNLFISSWKFHEERTILCDELEMSDRQKSIEKLLMIILAKETTDQLSTIVKENCYECCHDRPSQNDHDLCIEASHVELVSWTFLWKGIVKRKQG